MNSFMSLQPASLAFKFQACGMSQFLKIKELYKYVQNSSVYIHPVSSVSLENPGILSLGIGDLEWCLGQDGQSVHTQMNGCLLSQFSLKCFDCTGFWRISPQAEPWGWDGVGGQSEELCPGIELSHHQTQQLRREDGALRQADTK